MVPLLVGKQWTIGLLEAWTYIRKPQKLVVISSEIGLIDMPMSVGQMANRPGYEAGNALLIS